MNHRLLLPSTPATLILLLCTLIVSPVEGRGPGARAANTHATAAQTEGPRSLPGIDAIATKTWEFGLLGGKPGAAGLYSADIDGDGIKELLASNLRGNQEGIVVLSRSTSGWELQRFLRSSEAPPRESSPYTPAKITAMRGFFDTAAGRQRLALGYDTGQIRLIDPRSDSIVAELVPFPSAYGASEVNELFLHDFEGDGDPELVAIGERRDIVVPILSSRTLAPRIRHQISGITPCTRAVPGHFTRSDALELICPDRKIYEITLQSMLERGTVPNVNAIAAVNADGDALDELLVDNGNNGMAALEISGSTLWVKPAIHSNVHSLVDVDGDGRNEIATGYYGTYVVDILDSRSGDAVWSMSTQGGTVFAIHGDDYDQDGRLEIAWSSQTHSYDVTQIYLTDYQSREQTWSSEPIAGGLIARAAGDVDGDGRNEIVIAAQYLDDQLGPPVLLVYDGETFERKWSLPLDENSGGVSRIRFADTDGDGVKDILLAQAYGAAPAVFVVDGRTRREKRRVYRPNISGSAVDFQVGDVNADGRLDVVVLGWALATRGVFYTAFDAGNGAFLGQSSIIPESGVLPIDFSLLDADGNGTHEAWTVLGGRLHSYNVQTNQAIAQDLPASPLTALAPPGSLSARAIVGTAGGQLQKWTGVSYSPLLDACTGEVQRLEPATSGALYVLCRSPSTMKYTVALYEIAPNSIRWTLSDISQTPMLGLGSSGNPSDLLSTGGYVANQYRFGASGQQAIQFATPGDQVLGAPPIGLVTSGGASGNPVVVSSLTPRTCQTTGDHGHSVSLLASGICIVRAIQGGNANWLPAAPVYRRFQIAAGGQTVGQTISFPELAERTVTSAPFLLSASGGSSGQPVVFGSLTPSACQVSGVRGETVTLVNIGVCTIRASQAGSATHFPAQNVERSFVVAKAAQSIRFYTSTALSVGQVLALSASGGSSGHPVVFGTSTPSRCSVSGNQLTALSGGDCIVTADQSGSAIYAPAPQVARTLAIYAAGSMPSVPRPLAVAIPAGAQSLLLEGLPALTNARFSGTPLATPAVVSASRGMDSNASSPYDSLSDGVLWTPIVVPAAPADAAREYMIVAVAESAAAPKLRLFLGEDLNGNGPSATEMRCERTTAAAGQLCEVRITRAAGSPAATWWAVAQNLHSGPPGNIRLAAAAVPFFAENKSLIVTGPGRVDANAPFNYRVSWDDPTWLPGQERVGYALVYSAPGTLAFYEPIWLRRQGTDSSAYALSNAVPRAVRLLSELAEDRLYFDVPANATSVTFSTQGSGEVDLYLAHVAAPTGPAIAPAPSRAAAQHRAQLPGANQSITLTGAQLLPGRWYVTPVNRGASTAAIDVTATINGHGTRPVLRPGHYFNPARSGHGLFLDYAGDQWVMVWYTYLQDGTPTWYYSQGLAPVGDGSQWNAPLFRVVWNGSAASATQVGNANFTLLPGAPQDSPKLTMSFNLDGDSGWEPLTRLGDDACPAFNGQPLDAQGHWFSPARSGFGYSAQFLPNTEVHAAYIYDDLGYPRWLYGQKDFDANAVAVPLLQLTGFCPTCAAVPLTSTTVGSMTRLLASDSNNDGKPGLSHIEVNATLAAPLNGTWQQSLPVFLLSQRKGCQ